MGNSTAYINYNSPFEYTSDINQQIEQDGNLLHPMLGHIQLWRFMKWRNPEIFSRIQYYSHHHSTLREEHQLRSSLKHDNLLQYYGCTISTASNIDSVFREEQFYEYIPTTLHNLLNKNRVFYELDIWNFLNQISSVCAYIYSKKRYQGLINENSVFVLNDQTFKIIDQYQDLSNQNCEKQDIKDLGKLVLKMMQNDNPNQLNRVQLVRALAEQNRYSLQLMQLIGKIVHGDIPHFNQITELVKNRKQTPIILKEQNCSKSFITTSKQLPAGPIRETAQFKSFKSTPIQYFTIPVSQQTVISNYSSQPVPLRRVLSPPPSSVKLALQTPDKEQQNSTTQGSFLSYKSKLDP